ncbi:MAG: hypothetical protein Tsb0017_10080 [Geothermobacteraceae bacterium]
MTAKQQIINQTKTNPFATAWIIVLMGILGITALCTAVLVGWPAIAYLAAKFFN